MRVLLEGKAREGRRRRQVIQGWTNIGGAGLSAKQHHVIG